MLNKIVLLEGDHVSFEKWIKFINKKGVRSYDSVVSWNP